MKRIRLIVGITLIACSIIAMITWETKGREALLMEEVIVASEHIDGNVKINGAMLTTANVLKENLVEGSMGWEEVDRIKGKIALHDIAKNQQIIKADLVIEQNQLEDDTHIFPLKAQWIAARSSSLRKNDWVAIYQASNGEYMGTYLVAFVKDEAEQEIRDDSKGKGKPPLLRTDSTGKISHIEIVATIEEYQNIYSITSVADEENLSAGQLILVGVQGRDE